MKKIRAYNFWVVFGILCLLSIPMLLRETTKLTSIMPMVLFCTGCALYVESSITFKVVKVVDELKWVNDLGQGPIYVLVKILGLLFVILGVTSMWMDINKTNMILIAYGGFILPLSFKSSYIYVGKNYIYAQNRFIRIKDIISFEKNVLEQGKCIGDTEFILQVDNKTYKIKFKPNMSQGISTFTHALQDKNE